MESLNLDQRKRMFDYLNFQKKMKSDKDKEEIAERLDELMKSTPNEQLWVFNHINFNKFKKILEGDIEMNHTIRKALVFENLRLRLFLDIYRHHGLYRECIHKLKEASQSISKEEWIGFLEFIDRIFNQINKDKTKDDSIIDPLTLLMMMKKIRPEKQKQIDECDKTSDEYLELLQQQDWIENTSVESVIKIAIMLDQYLVVELGRDRLFQRDVVTELECLVEDELNNRDIVISYLKVLDCDKNIIKNVINDNFPFLGTIGILDKFLRNLSDDLKKISKNNLKLEEVRYQLGVNSGKFKKDPQTLGY